MPSAGYQRSLRRLFEVSQIWRCLILARRHKMPVAADHIVLVADEHVMVVLGTDLFEPNRLAARVATVTARNRPGSCQRVIDDGDFVVQDIGIDLVGIEPFLNDCSIIAVKRDSAAVVGMRSLEAATVKPALGRSAACAPSAAHRASTIVAMRTGDGPGIESSLLLYETVYSMIDEKGSARKKHDCGSKTLSKLQPTNRKSRLRRSSFASPNTMAARHSRARGRACARLPLLVAAHVAPQCRRNPALAARGPDLIRGLTRPSICSQEDRSAGRKQ